jgi:hypothetical protein
MKGKENDAGRQMSRTLGFEVKAKALKNSGRCWKKPA